MRAWIICFWMSLNALAAAQTSFAELRTADPVPTPEQLVRMSEVQLVELYRSGTASPLPEGYIPGRIILQPGSAITAPVSRLMHWTAWQGKYIHDGRMTNRTFFVPSITTPIEVGASYMDGRPSVVLDYAGSRPFFVRNYRDEVRELSPGIFLGMMHRRDHNGATIATWFALDARAGCGFAGPAKPQPAFIEKPPARTGP